MQFLFESDPHSHAATFNGASLVSETTYRDAYLSKCYRRKPMSFERSVRIVNRRDFSCHGIRFVFSKEETTFRNKISTKTLEQTDPTG